MIQVGDEIKWNLPIGGYLTYKVCVDIISDTRKPSFYPPTPFF